MFSFIIFCILPHCLLASKASDKKYAILLRSPCIQWFASLLLLSRFFLVFSFLKFDYGVLGVGFFEFTLLGFAEFFGYLFMTSIKFGHLQLLFLPIFSLPLFLFLLLEFPKCICWSIWWFSTGPLGSFSQINNFHCLIFNFADFFSSVRSNLLLIPLANFSFQLLHFSVPESVFFVSF